MSNKRQDTIADIVREMRNEAHAGKGLYLEWVCEKLLNYADLIEAAAKRRRHSNGVYFDRSTKGEVGKQHHSYRAEVVEDGRRIRRRFCSYEDAQEWIAKMLECGGAE